MEDFWRNLSRTDGDWKLVCGTTSHAFNSRIPLDDEQGRTATFSQVADGAGSAFLGY